MIIRIARGRSGKTDSVCHFCFGKRKSKVVASGRPVVLQVDARLVGMLSGCGLRLARVAVGFAGGRATGEKEEKGNGEQGEQRHGGVCRSGENWHWKVGKRKGGYASAGEPPRF